MKKKKAGEPIAEGDWQRLFASEGYVRLKKREASMGRSFTDEDFKAFVLSEKTLAAAGTYEAQLARWKTLDARAAAALALKYLPAGTALRGSIYPSIKPRENSFVFELSTNPAIFVRSRGGGFEFLRLDDAARRLQPRGARGQREGTRTAAHLVVEARGCAALV